MALTDNNGTQYYGISCGVPSGVVNLTSNNGTRYHWASANDYILYGQSIAYPALSDNNDQFTYLYRCGVPSDSDLILSANNGTKYYYSSSFNCVTFCDGSGSASSSFTIQDFVNDDMIYVWDEWNLESGVSVASGGELLTWVGGVSGNMFDTAAAQSINNKAIVSGDHIFINGITGANARYLTLSTANFGGNDPRSRKTFWIMETDFEAASGANNPLFLASHTSSFDLGSVAYVKSLSTFRFTGSSLPTLNYSVSSILSGGTHTYIIETGSDDNGGFKLNGITIPPDASSVYWSRNRWSIGAFSFGSPTVNTYNTLPIKLKGIVFMKNPSTSVAIPASAADAVRDYLIYKYNPTM